MKFKSNGRVELMSAYRSFFVLVLLFSASCPLLAQGALDEISEKYIRIPTENILPDTRIIRVLKNKQAVISIDKPLFPTYAGYTRLSHRWKLSPQLAQQKVFEPGEYVFIPTRPTPEHGQRIHEHSVCTCQTLQGISALCRMNMSHLWMAR